MGKTRKLSLISKKRIKSIIILLFIILT